MSTICDPAAERAILSGIYHYGNDLYLDICDIVKPSTFTIDSNKMIFNCLVDAFKSDDNIKIDFPTILSSAKKLGYSHILERKDEISHLQSIISLKVEQSNVRKFAAKARKLEVARLLHNQMGVGQEKVLNLDGSESIANIIGIVEDIVFDFSSLLDTDDNEPQLISHNIDEYLDYLEANPVDQIGIPTGFYRWDKSVGGGLRKGTVNFISARPKSGKTTLSINMCVNISKLNYPVLNLDTEMNVKDNRHKTIANMSSVKIHSIENGKYGQNPTDRAIVRKAAQDLKGYPYYYKSIAGQPFEETLALMRRWIQKKVGLNSDGTAKDCVIFFDYLKLMSGDGVSESLKEYQILGFMITALHNFAARYQIPIVCFGQTTRDGIDKESTAVAAGSDRIIWLCSNFSILKIKSDEEVAQDGPKAGSRKLVTICSRHGEGMESGDYVNLRANLACGQFQEGLTKFELSEGKKEDHDGLINDDGKDIPFE